MIKHRKLLLSLTIMTAQNEAPVVIATWAGVVNNDWYLKAEELLNTIDEYVSYSSNGVGLFVNLKITSKTTSSELVFKVDAKGKARGVLRLMEDDTYVFLLFLMALSKVAPFALADEYSQIPRMACNPNNHFFKNLNVPFDKINEVGVILGIAIPDKKRYMPGCAAFF